LVGLTAKFPLHCSARPDLFGLKFGFKLQLFLQRSVGYLAPVAEAVGSQIGYVWFFCIILI